MSRGFDMSAVPLPQVEQVTDRVAIGQLGLPPGFDDERLTLNLKQLLTFQHAAGLGHLSIVATEGQRTELIGSMTGISADGSASLGKVSVANRPAPASAELTFPYEQTTMNGRPSALITLNRTLIDEGIADRRGIVRDPATQAKPLNRAATKGGIRR